MGTGSSFPGAERPGREADHSPLTEVRECLELYLHFPNTPSWRGALLSTGTTLPLPHLYNVFTKYFFLFKNQKGDYCEFVSVERDQSN
jgi:hypothetical protein